MPKKCSLEGINSEISNLNRILIGNGTKGLIRKVEEIKNIINDIKITLVEIKLEQNRKAWIYRGVIVALFGTTTFLLTRAYYLKFM